MNEETKMAPSQCACADGFKSLLHKYTVLPLDSSLFQAWLQACPWGNSAKTLELAVCEQSFCPDTWVFSALVHSDQATLDIGELSLSVFPLISAVIQSALAESASAFLWRSALLMNLCSEVLFLFASRIVMNKIQRWHDPSEVQHGEAMNKDEDSSF